MKKIMFAGLTPCQTEGEYQWIESSEADGGWNWDGDIRGYLINASEDEGLVAEMMAREYTGAIHNLPEDAIVLVAEEGRPLEIWWAEDDGGPGPYRIMYGTGAGDDAAPSLEEAIQIADDGAAYTQQDIIIADSDGTPVLRRSWCSYISDEAEQEARENSAVPGSDWIWFGSFGGFAPWSEA